MTFSPRVFISPVDRLAFSFIAPFDRKLLSPMRERSAL